MSSSRGFRNGVSSVTWRLVQWHGECSKRALTGEVKFSRHVDGLTYFRYCPPIYEQTENLGRLGPPSQAGMSERGVTLKQSAFQSLKRPLFARHERLGASEGPCDRPCAPLVSLRDGGQSPERAGDGAITDILGRMFTHLVPTDPGMW